jgi:UrcA family protein
MTYFSKFNDLWHGAMLAALTACMAVGLADVARAASPDAAPSVRVSYGDLDLANAQGVHTLHARLTAAARQVCAPDGFDTRNLQLFANERACMSQAVANAEAAVQVTRVAKLGAHRDQG